MQETANDPDGIYISRDKPYIVWVEPRPVIETLHQFWWEKRERSNAAWQDKLADWKAGVAGWVTPSAQRG